MRVGFGRERLVPPLPFDPQGQAARTEPADDVDDALSVTACVIVDDDRVALAILGADVLAHTSGFARSARGAVAAAIGCPPTRVLLNASHTHASLWPGMSTKVSGGDLGHWWPREKAYIASLPEVYASAARLALAAAVPARAAWSHGRVPDRIGSRRRRDHSGAIVIGWDPARVVDETVTVLRFDDPRGRTLGTIVGFGCHPVVLGHQVRRASSDYVGPLRATVEASIGGLCLFLQGASGDVQPLEALHPARGPEVELGRRIGLEAAHAAADLAPWPRRRSARRHGRWTPTIVYRSSPRRDPPQQEVSVQASRIRVPLGPIPSPTELAVELLDLERRRALIAERPHATTNGVDVQLRWARALMERLRPGRIPTSAPAEVWVARIGDGAFVGIPAELFSEPGMAIVRASPAPHTFVAGCSDGVLGYVPSAASFDEGGFEVTTAHRIYGAPAAVAPPAADLLVDTALGHLRTLFAARLDTATHSIDSTR